MLYLTLKVAENQGALCATCRSCRSGYALQDNITQT
ncbi:hypothetical protein SRDD_16820 [Serratia sp. DD3]|nr:hypothetical protein SRDD_45130 [Serratia sp. DD3]KEY56688.1 hypothetical protein SRDD_42770 [Serratia sp. DD3]KEY59399.1 hypothetical protein SRDD_16820 [Serratia sp. DD3]